MSLICGVRNTGRAIRYSYFNIFRRSKRDKVFILITTGPSKDRVNRPSSYLKKTQVESFAIGIGKHYSLTQLLQIATDKAHVYTVGFRNIESLTIILKKKLCSCKYTKKSRNL